VSFTAEAIMTPA